MVSDRSALILRVAIMVDASTSVVVYGAPWCPHCRAARHELSRRQKQFEVVDVSQHPQVQAWLKVGGWRW